MTDRRTFLAGALLGGAALATTGGARAAEPAPAPCADPAALSLSQRSRRRALGYADQSADPAKHCGLCAFFTGDAKGCGTCQMLSGGPVSASGLCTSFAPRPAN